MKVFAIVLMLAAGADLTIPEEGAPGREFRAAAVALGKHVDVARSRGMTRETLQQWSDTTAELRRRTLATRRSLEAAAGEDELALERLFRSSPWSELGFTLAATRYWQSWLALDRYQITGSPTDLAMARHGFQTTLVLIVYPGLVRGSWLGLGYAALAEQDNNTARLWFGRVAMGDDALAETASSALSLLSALETVPPTRDSIAMDEADELEAEAITLLQRHGRTLDGARAAAERLRVLETGGQMTRPRVDRLLVYRDQIIGHEIGPVGFLVSAEDALDHQQYYTAVQKYQAFFEALGNQRAADFSAYRLRYADALVASGLAAAALKELAVAEGREDVASLRHLATAIVYSGTGTDLARADYARAAGQAEDLGAAFSRLLLARDLGGAGDLAQRAARRHDPWFARTPAFELVYRELRRPGDKKTAVSLAQLGMTLLRRLGRSVRKEPWARIAEVDLDSYLAADVTKVLEALDELEETLRESGLKGQLFAIRVAVLARRNDKRLLSLLTNLDAPLDDEQKVPLLTNLFGCDKHPWCLDVTDRLIILFADDPVNLLHLELQRARLLAAAGQLDDVYYLARTLVATYPASGDVWALYAAAARDVGRSGDADLAYARIVESVPIGSDVWREAQLERLQLRVQAGAAADACALRATVKVDARTEAAVVDALQASGIPCRP